MLPLITLRATPVSRRILSVGVVALAFALLGGAFVAEVAAQNIFGTDCLPPPLSTYAGSFHAKYADGTNIYDLSNPEHSKFTGCDLPSPSGCTSHMFGSFVQADFSVNMGLPMSVNGSGNTRIQVCFDNQNGPTRFFDTEMLQLDISGGPLMIRESPTLPSLGRTAITDLGGMYRIDSFFDVFTELSLDGGQTWLPSTDAAGNPYAGRVMIPGTVAVSASSWAKMKVLYK